MYSACLAKSSFAAVVVVAPVVFWVIFNATRKHWRNKENTSARLRWRTEEEVEDIILSEARICDFERYNCVNIREKNFQIKNKKTITFTLRPLTRRPSSPPRTFAS